MSDPRIPDHGPEDGNLEDCPSNDELLDVSPEAAREGIKCPVYIYRDAFREAVPSQDRGEWSELASVLASLRSNLDRFAYDESGFKFTVHHARDCGSTETVELRASVMRKTDNAILIVITLTKQS